MLQGTRIHTVEGFINVENLVGQTIDVFGMGDQGQLEIVPARVELDREDQVRILQIFNGRQNIIIHPDDFVYILHQGWKRVNDLEIGDRFVGFNRKMNNEQQAYIGLTGTKYLPEHRFVAGHYWDIAGLDIHHLDGNHLNNIKSNLQPLTHSEHSRLTNIGHKDWNIRGMDGKYAKKAVRKAKDTYRLNENPRGIRPIVKQIDSILSGNIVSLYKVITPNNIIANGIIYKTLQENE